MGKDDERTAAVAPQPDKIVSVDDMTDEQLGEIIQGNISLSESITRYKRSDHVDLDADQKNDIVKLVIEIWRIKEEMGLYKVAKEVSRQFETEIDFDYHSHPKFITDPREALDSTKGKVIGMVTPKRIPNLPTSAHDYPKYAINDLVQRKKWEKPKPPKLERFGGLL